MIEHFDKISEDYSHLRPTYLPLMEQLAKILSLRQGNVVLDIGCGPGDDLKYLEQQYAIHPIGIDCSKEMVAQALTKWKHKNVICKDIHHYLANSNIFFDAVYAKFSLHHISNINHLLASIAKRLHNGSGFAAITMNIEQVKSMRLANYFPTMKSKMLEAANEIENLKSIMAKHGLNKIDSDACVVGHLVWDNSLLGKIHGQFISFLNCVPEAELQEGLKQIEWEIDSISSVDEEIKGSIIYGYK